MKLDQNTKSKLVKASKSCPNCTNNVMVVVPDVLSLKHEEGYVDLASTVCPKCGFQAIFNIQVLKKTTL